MNDESVDWKTLEGLSEATTASESPVSGNLGLDDLPLHLGGKRTANENSWWHLTTNPNFALDPDYNPENNTTMGGRWPHRGLFVSQDPEQWYNGHDYVRPFAVELEGQANAMGGYSGEHFIPAEQFGQTNVKRVIPYNAYVAERFEGTPYSGQDVREMTPEQHKQHFTDTNEMIRNERPHMLTFPCSHCGAADENWNECQSCGKVEDPSRDRYTTRGYLPQFKGKGDFYRTSGKRVASFANRIPFFMWPNGLIEMGQPGDDHTDITLRPNSTVREGDHDLDWDKLFEEHPEGGEFQGHFLFDDPEFGNAEIWPADLQTMQEHSWITPEYKQAARDAAQQRWRQRTSARTAGDPNGGDLHFQVGDRVELPSGGGLGTVIEMYEDEQNEDGTVTHWMRVKKDDGQIVQAPDAALRFVQGLEGGVMGDTIPWGEDEQDYYRKSRVAAEQRFFPGDHVIIKGISRMPATVVECLSDRHNPYTPGEHWYLVQTPEGNEQQVRDVALEPDSFDYRYHPGEKGRPDEEGINQLWPDTLPWGDAEQNYYRTSATYPVQVEATGDEKQPQQRIANESSLYHVAPTSARDSITTHGLMPGKRTYMWEDAADAHNFGMRELKQPYDVWEINGQGLRLQRDTNYSPLDAGEDDEWGDAMLTPPGYEQHPYNRYAYYTDDPIGPEQIQHLDVGWPDDTHTAAHAKSSDYNGWTNWDTWNTALMMDNEQDSYNEVRKLVEKGGDADALRDWAIHRIIGPENKRSIEDAQEWNDVPEEERVDHHYEDFKEKHPESMDLLHGLVGGPDVGDSQPTLIDPELVNWDEIHQHIIEEFEENARYEQMGDKAKQMGIEWYQPGSDPSAPHNLMHDAWMKHHGIMSQEQRLPNGAHAGYHTILQLGDDQLPSGKKTTDNYWGEPERYEFPDKRPMSVDEYGWDTGHDIQHGKANPHQLALMQQALAAQGHTPEQIAQIMQQVWRYNPETQQREYLNAPAPAAPDPSLDQPGEMTLPEHWGATDSGVQAYAVAQTARKIREGLATGTSWMHLAQGLFAWITHNWPTLTPDQASEILSAAAHLEGRGQEPSIADMGDRLTIPASDQFPFPEMGNDPRWSKTAELAQQRYYHGTNVALTPGEILLPGIEVGREHNYPNADYYDQGVVYMSTQEHLAERYAVGIAGRNGGDPHVYQVEPLGEVWPDKEQKTGWSQDQFVTGRARVIAEVPLPGLVHWNSDAGSIMRGPAPGPPNLDIESVWKQSHDTTGRGGASLAPPTGPTRSAPTSESHAAHVVAQRSKSKAKGTTKTADAEVDWTEPGVDDAPIFQKRRPWFIDTNGQAQIGDAGSHHPQITPGYVGEIWEDTTPAQVRVLSGPDWDNIDARKRAQAEAERAYFQMMDKTGRTAGVIHHAPGGGDYSDPDFSKRTPYLYDYTNDIVHMGQPGWWHNSLDHKVAMWNRDHGIDVEPFECIPGAVAESFNGEKLNAVYRRYLPTDDPDEINDIYKRLEQHIGSPVLLGYDPDSIMGLSRRPDQPLDAGEPDWGVISKTAATQRLFVAFDIDATTQQNVHDLQAELIASHPGLRPEVDPHITIAFIGDVDTSVLPQLAQEIARIKERVPLPTFTVAAYEELERLSWLRLTDDGGGSQGWYNELSQWLSANLGWSSTFPTFIAHITLFRYDQAMGITEADEVFVGRPVTTTDVGVYSSSRETGYTRVADAGLDMSSDSWWGPQSVNKFEVSVPGSSPGMGDPARLPGSENTLTHCSCGHGWNKECPLHGEVAEMHKHLNTNGNQELINSPDHVYNNGRFSVLGKPCPYCGGPTFGDEGGQCHHCGRLLMVDPIWQPGQEGEDAQGYGHAPNLMAIHERALQRQRSSAVGDNWVWLDGKIGFGQEHHDIARDLAQQLGYDQTGVAYISNSVARNFLPEDKAIAVGTMQGGHPQIWMSTRDRNAIWDDVSRERDKQDDGSQEPYDSSYGAYTPGVMAPISSVVGSASEYTCTYCGRPLEEKAPGHYYCIAHGFIDLDGHDEMNAYPWESDSPALQLPPGWGKQGADWKSKYDYRKSSGSKDCGSCAAFIKGRCDMFKAKVEPANVCDEWTDEWPKKHQGATITSMAERTATIHEVESELDPNSESVWRPGYLFLHSGNVYLGPEGTDHYNLDIPWEHEHELAGRPPITPYAKINIYNKPDPYAPNVPLGVHVAEDSMGDLPEGVDEWPPDLTAADLTPHLGTLNQLGSPVYFHPVDGTSPQRLAMVKTAMAERTGDPQLDALLAEFTQELETKQPGLIQRLRNPETATGACGEISSWFHDWLWSKQVPSWTEEGAGFAGTFHDPELDMQDPPHPWTGFSIHKPDQFGYTDRTVMGEDGHEATLLRSADGSTYMIDWTAAQYGYKEFPMVQRLDGEQWQREWTAAAPQIMYHVAPAHLRNTIATEGLRAMKPSQGPAVANQPSGIYAFNDPVEARRYRDTYGGDIWSADGTGAIRDPGFYAEAYYLPSDRPATLFAKHEDLDGKCWRCGQNPKGVAGDGSLRSVCQDCMGWHPSSDANA